MRWALWCDCWLVSPPSLPIQQLTLCAALIKQVIRKKRANSKGTNSARISRGWPVFYTSAPVSPLIFLLEQSNGYCVAKESKSRPREHARCCRFRALLAPIFPCHVVLFWWGRVQTTVLPSHAQIYILQEVTPFFFLHDLPNILQLPQWQNSTSSRVPLNARGYRLQTTSGTMIRGTLTRRLKSH